MSIIGTIAAIAANGAQNFGNALIGSYFNRKAASKANQYALYMSNTAHQREVADLQAAGLNPVLSALGSGASTVATPVASSGDDFQRAQSDTVNSAMRSALKKEQEQADADISLTEGQAKLAERQAKLVEAQTALESANAAKSVQEAEIQAEQRATRLQLLKQELSKGVWQAYQSFATKQWFKELPASSKWELILAKEFPGNSFDKAVYYSGVGYRSILDWLKDKFFSSESPEDFRKKLETADIELIYQPKNGSTAKNTSSKKPEEKPRKQSPIRLDSPSPLHHGQSVMFNSARRFSHIS